MVKARDADRTLRDAPSCIGRQQAALGAASPTPFCCLDRPVTLDIPLRKNITDKDMSKRWVRHTNLRLRQTTGMHVAVFA